MDDYKREHDGDGEMGGPAKTPKIPNVERSDPLQDYRRALIGLVPDYVNFATVSEGDRVSLKSKYLAWTTPQKRAYHALMMRLFRYLDRPLGPESVAVRFVWNYPTWHVTIIRIIQSLRGLDLEGATSVTKHCWLSTLASDQLGRPKIRVEPGFYEKRPEGNRNARSIFKFYRDTTVSTYETTAGRIVCILQNGIPAVENMQGSHLCRHVPPTCICPDHLEWDTDMGNKDRNGCAYGCAYLCPHAPKCVFTSPSGKFLPCRNDPTTLHACTCGGSCYGESGSSESQSQSQGIGSGGSRSQSDPGF